MTVLTDWGDMTPPRRPAPPTTGTLRVAAVIVTRGDVDLSPILVSLPGDWEKIVWDNGARQCRVDSGDEQWFHDVNNLGVYGRYAAVAYTEAELIYVQDDDVIVSDPQALVDTWDEMRALAEIETTTRPESFVVCNMPQEFRHDFYEEHALVGFGAAFHRDAPAAALGRMAANGSQKFLRPDSEFFFRCCDIVFTGLTPRVLVDVPKQDMPYAHYENRMWKQPGHQAERVRMLDLVREARDA